MSALFPVLLAVQIVVCIAMIGVILLQRSEGGGLGLGSGGGVSGLMTGRGAANAMTRTTVILATIFICTSIALALIAKASRTSGPLTPGTSGKRELTTLPGAPTPSPIPSPSSPPAIPQPSAPAPATPAAPAPASGGQSAPTTPAQPSGGSTP